jgi:hypothetical protein
MRPAEDAPPEYVEVADEAMANDLIRSGRAERVVGYPEEKKRGYLHPDAATKTKAPGAGYVDEDDDDDDDDDNGSDASTDIADDEAAWEIDDMVDVLTPPAYREREESAAAEESALQPEEVEVKREEQMIRDLVQLAGPPPQPVRRIPCPVIIPQRRPRQKERGFVRAYAPVLADCGISQDVFLMFLKDWYQASKVSFAPGPVGSDVVPSWLLGLICVTKYRRPHGST